MERLTHPSTGRGDCELSVWLLIDFEVLHGVVIDEVLGQWVALAGMPAFTPAACIGAFALFRLFDIWKPWPVRELESLPEGWGSNADDLMAGIYAALVLFVAGWFNLE